MAKNTQPNLGLWDSSKSGHEVEVIKHSAAKFEVHCLTCNFRPPTFCENEPAAETAERKHHWEVANGVPSIAKRGDGMGPAIRHARDMAERETTPDKERAEWTRLADEMERQLKTHTHTRPHEIIDGQADLFSTEGAPS